MPRQLVFPRDFGAGYGSGVRRGVGLGGGGLFFVAWQVAYLQELQQRGIDLASAGRVMDRIARALTAQA